MHSIQVAAGAIVNESNAVLVSQRAADSHQGGLWEFPGGKCEPGESVTDTLLRELEEEIGIQVLQVEPLITIRHAYPDKTVVLHVYRVLQYAGRPQSRENQPLEWRAISTLDPRDFPAADHGIIRALQLPRQCFITPDIKRQSRRDYLALIERVLTKGMRLAVLRNHQLEKADYLALAASVQALCTSYQARCILNMPPEWLTEIDCDGIHLTAARLQALSRRPADFAGLISASCHNEQELQHAVAVACDFAFISPVLPTPSHPMAQTLGWRQFEALAQQAAMPVFALGGMHGGHLSRVLDSGGQGVAGISAFL